MTKMTYVEALSNALSLLDAQIGNGFDEFDVSATIEKLTALKAQTEKRNSADKKPTKAQALNAELSEVITEVLANAADPMTVTEIMHADERLSSLSNQKVTAVLRSMGDKVVKVPDKRVNRFRLA